MVFVTLARQLSRAAHRSSFLVMNLNIVKTKFVKHELQIEDILAKSSNIVCRFVDAINVFVAVGTGALKQESQLDRWRSVH